ncbi:hypothetical protein Tco_0991868 [Tanacetum coccineum]|uniref:Uncharacterized protein n=1 Tax=Tanacetum coccineum TaxID=301880 RepID=A0ABQ5F189_9ASTR
MVVIEAVVLVRNVGVFRGEVVSGSICRVLRFNIIVLCEVITEPTVFNQVFCLPLADLELLVCETDGQLWRVRVMESCVMEKDMKVWKFRLKDNLSENDLECSGMKLNVQINEEFTAASCVFFNIESQSCKSFNKILSLVKVLWTFSPSGALKALNLSLKAILVSLVSEGPSCVVVMSIGMESTLLGLPVLPRLDPRGGGIADYYRITCSASSSSKGKRIIMRFCTQRVHCSLMSISKSSNTYPNFCLNLETIGMFTLPSISDSIKVQDINGDSYGTMKRNHGVPSDANLYVEEPLSVSSRKRIRQMDSDVKRSAAAKHKASTQERKLDIINRKRGAAANDKASPQAE